ncbi:uncharacterized protein LOC125775122 [Anopheles funestus]|uniref:uncharacterized protein LOC125775122 n=1 Tax=Anopheles funestus TaxID=62324 RepID=UPI0020C6D609|nr:uncharacterized protein LOC125775122 [Anopheles funestus]XP_049301594.1 uncharacterized protein LOC125775122 [Anopheles funestus]XP_049301602.1 uncharacterized protein LOC125775122 [Anopheles funestus]XP_049301611.1 uncharacterized protein LOC125775122 [Anopheles funestus]XP_049301619.1 uncharacterized protein LOC125775122 [Anopheles funestus]
MNSTPTSTYSKSFHYQQYSTIQNHRNQIIIGSSTGTTPSCNISKHPVIIKRHKIYRSALTMKTCSTVTSQASCTAIPSGNHPANHLVSAAPHSSVEEDMNNPAILKPGKLYRPKLIISNTSLITSAKVAPPASCSTPLSTTATATPDPIPVSAKVNSKVLDGISRIEGMSGVMMKSMSLLWPELSYCTDHKRKSVNTKEQQISIHTSSVEIPIIASADQLKRFNEQLQEEPYFHQLSDTQSAGKKLAKNLMHDAFVKLFKRELVVQCSWRGQAKQGTKVRIDENTHLLRLCRDWRRRRIQGCERRCRKVFFKTKLYNAKSCVNINKGVIKSLKKISHIRVNKVPE